MLIVNSNNGEIFYEGIDREDCLRNMPKGSKVIYHIIPFELYDEYIDELVSKAENQTEC